MAQTSFIDFNTNDEKSFSAQDFDEDTSGTWVAKKYTQAEGILTDSSESNSRMGNPNIYSVNSLFELFQASRLLCEDVPESRLKTAFMDATKVLNSGIFSEYVRPHIGVDEFGEFSFSLKNEHGYLDIGVSGDGAVSYHARNDSDPSQTAYGDCEGLGRSGTARKFD